ncbi:probable methyltransferase PMT15 [Neltuma alba]|uniref:probable methyltransferase PMT15 n=1 Tax=Neltuma alba TaxID=207710 RepID=UPI0010A4B561|nr:probable methyltransferase PMT15 [Prosopis alba]
MLSHCRSPVNLKKLNSPIQTSMANCLFLLHSCASRNSNRLLPNLPLIVITTVFCTVFYFIGLWQHSSGPVAIDAAYVIADSICLRPNSTTSSPPPPPPPPPNLDFTAHHHIADPVLAPEAARDFHFPPCDASLSEYTPCEDVNRSLKFDRDRLIYRERHCPGPSEVLRCRIPAPYGYRVPLRWPESREWVWYANVPHKELTVEKKKQNWVRFEGERFRFPGGGTMFPRGADAYIDDIGKHINLRDGSIRTAIDTGCGVASWGAHLMSRNILAVSFAPRDTHEAQVQFALERGVPALIGVLASIRLPYPSRSFDMAHCSRCLIPWGQHDGIYLTEVDRVLRPGGYWILSGPPINWRRHWKGWDRTRDSLQQEQDGIEAVAKSLCWKKLVEKGDLAIWQKPTNHIHCKITRRLFRNRPFCGSQDADKAWYTKLETCLTPLPEVSGIKEVSGGEVAKWPERLNSIPPRIRSGSVRGITGEMFKRDGEVWKERVRRYKRVDSQLAEAGRYRNVLDMNSHLGGFGAALAWGGDPVWVMNVVPVEAEPNTLGVIYERGLIGTYHNWCEAMSTYPRTYDFIHAAGVFSLYRDRCPTEEIVLEMDRVLRPRGSVIVRDDVDVVMRVKTVAEAVGWQTTVADHEDGPLHRHKILSAFKPYWTAPPPPLS